MTTRARDGAVERLVVCLLLLLPALPSRAAELAAPLAAALESARAADEIPVVVRLADRVDPRAFGERNRRVRRRQLVTALRRKADLTQAPLRSLLDRRGARNVVRLWILNGLATRARPDVIRELAALPGIEWITLDATLSVPDVAPASAAPPEWNLTVIGAPVLWDLGYAGTGMVVASMDTGVDLDHPDVGPSWRGGTNSWFDPNGQHLSPADDDGHGTQTMGLLVGGAAGGTAIGVAPGAHWISVKIFADNGQASLSGIHQGFQWLLDPDGNSSTDDAPDVVNHSWGLNGTVGDCDREFEPDVEVLRAAGIGVVFSAGNAGPAASTSLSPANYASAVAIGAVNSTGTLASFSGRGPSACDGDLYPDVVAPGVSVKTADLTFGGVFPDSYVHASGTSFAAPHVAAGMALLMEAHPDRSLAEIEAAITESAIDGGATGPDHGYGYGRLDLPSAHDWLETHTFAVADVRVSASADDAEEHASGNVDLTSSRLELVHDGDDQTVGLRFAGLDVPPGATVTRAHVQFQVDQSTVAATSLVIWGEAAASAQPFSASANDVSSRSRTVTTVTWPEVAPWPTAGAAAAPQRTPNIAPLLQEIIDRGDWLAGNALAIIVQGTGARVAASWDGNPPAAPLLHVEYSLPLPPPTTTTSTTTTTTETTTSTTESTSTTTTESTSTTTESTSTTTEPTTTSTTQSTTTSTSEPTTTTESTTSTTESTTTSTSSTTSTLPPVVQMLDIPVRSNNDDVEESSSGTVDRGSSDLELVRDSNNQTVGVRFTGIPIPAGAAIDRAFVQFKVDETGSEATNLTITAHNVGNAPAFTTGSRNVSSRPRTVAVSWSGVPPWPTVGARGAAQQTADIRTILQQLVNRADWASGNAVVIILQGTGRRTAESYEGDQAGAPALHVEFHTGVTAPSTTTTITTTSTTTSLVPSTTSTTTSLTTTTTLPSTARTLDIPVRAANDDAEESAGGSVDRGSSDLELVRDSTNQRVGMRFTGVAIPAGAIIDRAYIQFKVDETSSEATNLTLTGHNVGNAPAFTTSSGSISTRPRTVSVAWPSVPAWPTVGARGGAQQTPDIKAILQQLVDRADWASGNAVVIIVDGTGRRVAEAYEGDQAGAATLHVEYRGG